MMPLRHDFVQSDTSATSLAFGGGASDGHETSMVKHRQAAQALCKKKQPGKLSCGTAPQT